MYRIIEGRGTGKTSRLMLFAKENNAIFVCGNPDAMRYKAKAYGIDSVNFILVRSISFFSSFGLDIIGSSFTYLF